MLIRLAWDWLGRWHEPLVVGAAVTLGGLTYCLPPQSSSGATAAKQSPAIAASHQRGELVAVAALTGGTARSLPKDAQYYRDLWARDAQAFYSRQRPVQTQGQEATLVRPVAAVAPAGGDHPAAVAQAGHRDLAPAVKQETAAGLSQRSTPLTASDTQGVRRMRVASCLAAGMLASLVFAALWPAVGSRRVLAAGKRPAADDSASPSRLVDEGAAESSKAATDDVIALTIPSAWIQVRPTAGQMLRRVVLASSYLGAALGGWLLFS